MKYTLIIFFLQLIFLTSIAQTKPKKPYQLYEEAEAAYNQGKVEDAIILLNECLTINPGYMEAYVLRAPARELTNDLQGALTDYSIYLEKFPDNPDILMSRAVLRYKLGFLGQSEEDFKRMLTLTSPETNSIFFRQNMSVDEKNPMMTTTQQGHNPYVYNYLGLIKFKEKKFKDAIVRFDTAIRLDPRQPDFYVNRGLAKESINDSTAIVDYDRALGLNPNHVLAKHNRQALLEKKKQQLSLEDRLTLTIKEDSTMLLPYLERAQQRYEGGYFKGALEDYNHALSIDSTNVEIWLGRGLTHEKLKDYTRAFSDYTKAIDLKENYAKAWLNRGNVLLKLERYNDAIEDYTVALIYWPDYPLAFYNRGMAKIKLKKNAEACADFSQAELLGMKIDEKLRSKFCK
ncbi:tetratricopeptide repeat protein [Chryseosolibacter indicus]|uniref:Tetratricopeptide repeat protein n=1 Tax=Chryseosolibacter indicus TaxID=2782351 RepID=A0ABS5VJW2_9BACT|nr:tetratricopeptide repeat protein [Chryseosolibacter indicus]MBT1701717.1 tetratricopeptide repeat protein [Chryseosolibacter indicus]